MCIFIEPIYTNNFGHNLNNCGESKSSYLAGHLYSLPQTEIANDVNDCEAYCNFPIDFAQAVNALTDMGYHLNGRNWWQLL